MIRDSTIEALVSEAAGHHDAGEHKLALDKLSEAQRLLELQRRDRFAQVVTEMRKGDAQ